MKQVFTEPFLADTYFAKGYQNVESYSEFDWKQRNWTY